MAGSVPAIHVFLAVKPFNAIPLKSSCAGRPLVQPRGSLCVVLPEGAGPIWGHGRPALKEALSLVPDDAEEKMPGDQEHDRIRRVIEQMMATQEPAPIGSRSRECVGAMIARKALEHSGDAH